MSDTLFDQQNIRNYLLKRLSDHDQEAFEIWLLDTPGALEQVELEQAMLAGASTLTKTAVEADRANKNTLLHQLKTHLIAPANIRIANAKTVAMTSVAATVLLALSVWVLMPSAIVQHSFQRIYIEQLRSAATPTINISSQDETANYQLMILLDDYQPPSFLVTIKTVVSQRLIFSQTISPNSKGELPVILRKSLLDEDKYVLHIKPITIVEPITFLLKVTQ